MPIWEVAKEASVLENDTIAHLIPSPDNNDGISIIDVTDPMAPSYCFVSFDGIEAEGELPSRVPLSAEDYARAYYPKYTLPAQNEAAETEEEAKRRRNSLSVEEDVQATIAKLKDVKLVSREMLSEAWPAEYEMAVDKKEATDAGTETDTSALLSLADMTMALAVTQAVQGGDTTDIEAMVWMPGKASLVKTTLRELSPFPDTGMVLLAKAIEKELETDKTQLDLSGFTLSSTQLESLISSMEGIETVNLSHTSTTTINDVRVILAKFTQLKRLALVDCPSVLSEDIHKLLDAEPQLFSHLEALIHPYFLGALKDASDTSPYRNAFSYIGVYTHSLKACSLPFFTPSRVIHALIDTLQPLGEPYHTYSFLQTSLAMQAAFASMREPGQKWSERRTVVIPQFSLRALKGEGWAFAITFGMFAVDGEGNGYAFLRFKHPSETVSEKKEAGVEASDAAAGPTDAPEMTWEIHDLASFINQVTLDGSARPTDEAVNKLQEILSILQMTQNMQLMGDEGVKKWLSSVKMLIQHLY